MHIVKVGELRHVSSMVGLTVWTGKDVSPLAYLPLAPGTKFIVLEVTEEHPEYSSSRSNPIVILLCHKGVRVQYHDYIVEHSDVSVPA